MSREISDALFNAIQSEVCPACPPPPEATLPVWGARSSNGQVSVDGRTFSTSEAVTWACARSDVFHSAGAHMFGLDLAPDTVASEELVAGFGNPAVDVDHELGGGIHGGNVNAFNSWCITDDGYITHGNNYQPESETGNPALFPCTRLIGWYDADIGGIWLATNAPGVAEAIAADAEVGVNPTYPVEPGTPLAIVMAAYRSNANSTTGGIVAGTLVPGLSGGRFGAW